MINWYSPEKSRYKDTNILQIKSKAQEAIFEPFLLPLKTLPRDQLTATTVTGFPASLKRCRNEGRCFNTAAACGSFLRFHMQLWTSVFFQLGTIFWGIGFIQKRPKLSIKNI